MPTGLASLAGTTTPPATRRGRPAEGMLPRHRACCAGRTAKQRRQEGLHEGNSRTASSPTGGELFSGEGRATRIVRAIPAATTAGGRRRWQPNERRPRDLSAKPEHFRHSSQPPWQLRHNQTTRPQHTTTTRSTRHPPTISTRGGPASRQGRGDVAVTPVGAPPRGGGTSPKGHDPQSRRDTTHGAEGIRLIEVTEARHTAARGRRSSHVAHVPVFRSAEGLSHPFCPSQRSRVRLSYTDGRSGSRSSRSSAAERPATTSSSVFRESSRENAPASTLGDRASTASRVIA